MNWQEKIGCFREVVLSIGNDKVVWEYIGEGMSGDYCEDDPDDVPLLRFSCYRLQQVWETGQFDWEELDNGSYCTQLTVDESVDNLLKAAQTILDRISGTDVYKRALEEMSWLEHADFETPTEGI
jgi:hypothetical protein